MSIAQGHPLYFWKNKEIVVWAWNTMNGAPVPREALCVDTNEVDPKLRYGLYIEHGGWKHIPVEKFSPEFRLRLLLLGVA